MKNRFFLNRIFSVLLAVCPTLGYADRSVKTFGVYAAGIESSKLQAIALEVRDAGFLHKISVSFGAGMSPGLQQWRGLRVSMDHDDGSENRTVTLSIEGGASEKVRAEVLAVIRFYIDSRCLGLSRNLSLDRAMQYVVRHYPSSKSTASLPPASGPVQAIAEHYCLPSGLIVAAPSLRQALGIADEEGISDFVLVDGESVLWFEYSPQRYSCLQIDRRFLTSPTLAEWMRRNQKRVLVRQEQIAQRLDISKRKDVQIVSAELKLYWAAVSELLEESGIKLITPADVLDFDSQLAAHP